MKVKKPKLLKKLTSRKKSAKDEVAQGTGGETSLHRINEANLEPFGDAARSPGSPVDDKVSPPLKLEISDDLAELGEDDDSDWETEETNSVGGTSADLMKCLNNLRIRSMSKGHSSPLNPGSLPRLAPPPPPSASSRGSLDMRASLEGSLLSTRGSLKPRNSVTSAISSGAETATVHVDTRPRSSNAMGSPRSRNSHPSRPANSGASFSSVDRSRISNGAAPSEASANEVSENGSVTQLKSSMSVPESPMRSPYESNFEEDVEWDAFGPASPSPLHMTASLPVMSTVASPHPPPEEPPDSESNKAEHTDSIADEDITKPGSVERGTDSGGNQGSVTGVDQESVTGADKQSVGDQNAESVRGPSEAGDDLKRGGSPKEDLESDDGTFYTARDSQGNLSFGSALECAIESPKSGHRRSRHTGRNHSMRSAMVDPSRSSFARSPSLPLPPDWQQFSIPLDEEIKKSTHTAPAPTDNLNPWMEDEAGEQAVERNLDQDTQGSKAESEMSHTEESLGNSSVLVLDTPPNPFAEPESFMDEWEDEIRRSASPGPSGLHRVRTPNPFADGSDSAVSDERRVLEGSFAVPGEYVKDTILDAAFHKTGLPQLQVIETVNAIFSGDRLTRYVVRGDVRMKLSAGQSPDSPTGRPLPDSDAFDPYVVAFQLKCVSANVYLKQFLANLEMIDDLDKVNERPGGGVGGGGTGHQGHHRRNHSLSMNEARQGIVESKVLRWNLGKCITAAHTIRDDGSQAVTLLRYSVRSNLGAPLRAQVRWRRPRKAGQSVVVDVALLPSPRLTGSLWGVTVTLKGLEHLSVEQGPPQGKSTPKAEWSAQASAFQWRVPVVYPEDGVRHLRLAVMDDRAAENQDAYKHLSAEVNFVMPHTTLSGTALQGWVEKREREEAGFESFGEEDESTAICKSLFCDSMCVSGQYAADVNYQ
ncbi:hypothetical protein BSKO_10034 [Bryopsis sp. KO-2023]|nr:hypothetical protein BSKO_10034 [Bryopsis sp. KO-2023]